MKNALNRVLVVVAVCLSVSPVYAEDKDLELAKKISLKTLKV